MLDLLQYRETLQKNTFFKGISREELAEIISCLEPQVTCYLKNKVVLQAGDPLPGIGIVLTGKLVISKVTASGDRTIIGQLYPSDTFGEVAALSESKQAPATVTAEIASEVLFFAPRKLTSSDTIQCSGYSKFVSNTIKLMANKAFVLNKKIDYLIIKSMRGKICAYLLDVAKKNGNTFTIPFNRNALADYLNVSRPSMSRELSKMQEEGLIRYQGNEIELLQIDKMEW